jgi:hypothetical protein
MAPRHHRQLIASGRAAGAARADRTSFPL